ncbi:hypothetical protein C8F04DRAFT_1177979 [Mycena alexandri]|uniref:Uncharacterized protein n=1 Tax=Mycena alexandri TaxID=1745969 RepID=A0AAD6X9E3_9AGAR|nr:hypothetical protein C8F04DRAFT_1177979 [Mycena alexandri]
MSCERTQSATIAANGYPYAPVRKQSSLISDHFFTRKQRIRAVFEGERLKLLQRWLPTFFQHVDAQTTRDFWPRIFGDYFDSFPWRRADDGSSQNPGPLTPQEIDVRVVEIKGTKAVRLFPSPFASSTDALAESQSMVSSRAPQARARQRVMCHLAFVRHPKITTPARWPHLVRRS